VLYGITADGLIDYEDVRQKALESKPKMIVAGFLCVFSSGRLEENA